MQYEEPVFLQISPPAKAHGGLPAYDSERQGRTSDIELAVIHEQRASETGAIESTRSDEEQVQSSVEEVSRNSKSKPPVYLQLATVYFVYFVVGFQDGTLGPLIPVIQRVYHVNFTIVSLNYVFVSVGLLSGALINIHIGQRVSFGKMILTGAILQTIGYCILAPAPPFPVLMLGQTIIGIAEAFQIIHANAFVTAFDSGTKLGVLHGTYGIGALVAPLISTQFARLPRWSFHWLVSLGLSTTNVALLASIFRLRDRNELIEEPISVPADERNRIVKWKEVLSLRAVHTMAFFILIYCGIEFTVGAWVATFILEERHGSPSSGYVTSGFFAGLMLGRLALLWVNKKLGTRKVMYFYALLALGLEFTIWFVPDLIGNAVSIALIGFFMGPMYPLIMGYAHQIIPTRLLSGAISWIVGFGTIGVSSLPFIEGAIASKFGIGSLQPFLVVMMCILIGLWAIVPPVKRRSE